MAAKKKRSVPKKAFEARLLYIETQNIWTVANRMSVPVERARRWIRQAQNHIDGGGS